MPPKGDAADEYVSDPANPVPYRPRPVRPTYPGPEWPVWMLQDQRFTHRRPDVLTYETEPLPETSELWEMENVLIQPHLSAAGKTHRLWL